MIKTVPIDDFIPSLRQIVNVTLDFLMEEALIKSAQEFCRKSDFIRYAWSLNDVSPGELYSLVDSLEVDNDEGVFQFSSLLSISGLEVGSTKERPLFTPDDYSILKRGDIVFNRDFVSFTAACSIEPNLSSKHLPAELFDEYLDGICSGAAARLLIQPDPDFSDPNLANYHRTQFIESMREARRFKLDANPQDTLMRPERTRSFY